MVKALSFRDKRRINRPFDVEIGVVPEDSFLVRWIIVVGAPVLEIRRFTQDTEPVCVSRRYPQLQMIRFCLLARCLHA